MQNESAGLEHFALERFAFLSQEKGFAQDVHTERIDWRETVFLYRHERVDIGVDIKLEFLERVVTVDVLKLKDGQLPTYQTAKGKTEIALAAGSESGERSRRPLELIPRDRLGVRDELLEEILQLNRVPYKQRDVHYMQTYLERSRALLIKYIDTLLQQPSSVLFGT